MLDKKKWLMVTVRLSMMTKRIAYKRLTTVELMKMTRTRILDTHLPWTWLTCTRVVVVVDVVEIAGLVAEVEAIVDVVVDYDRVVAAGVVYVDSS